MNPAKQHARGFFLLLLLLLLLTTPGLDAEEWSRFRGPNGSGVSTATGFPAEFGPDKNVRWKAPVRAGKSSPVLTSRRIFLTSFSGEKLYTQCFDRETGKLLWERSIGRRRKALLHQLNEPASASPVTDGRNVYVFFEDWGLFSYDETGELRWKTPLGRFSNEQGLGASPILVDGVLVLQVDQADSSYIVAFDPANGETKWRTDRPEKDSWATPLVHRQDTARILTVSSRLFGAYDPATGKRTLTEQGAAGVMVASPVLAGDTIYAFGYNFETIPDFGGALSQYDGNGDGKLAPAEYEGHSFYTAVATFWGDRDGDLEQQDWNEIMGYRGGRSRLVAMRLDPGGGARELWNFESGFTSVIPSPLVYDGVLYYVKNGGILTAIDAETGKMLKRGRLREAIDGYSSSPVAADGKIYFASESGKVSVVKPGAEWEVMLVNDLNDGVFATPALSGGAIFVRTDSWLYCFTD